MIQRKKRQVKIVLMIIAILAALAFAIIGVITVIDGKGTNTEIQEGTQGDLSQYELKSLIVTTKLSENDLKEKYNARAVNSLTFGTAETETYEVKYNTEEETRDAYEKLKNNEQVLEIEINKR